jgi:hypothetical protein
VTATGQESGAPVEIRAAHECTIRYGRLVRFKVYGDRAEALEAVGLGESTLSGCALTAGCNPGTAGAEPVPQAL